MAGTCFLERFPQARRGGVNTIFLNAARRLRSTPQAVVAEVLRVNAAREDRQDLCALMAAHPQEALDLAEHALAWDSLPADVRAAKKAEGARQGIEAHMAALPPTEKQLDLLRQHGGAVVPKTRLEASRLIDQILGSQP